MEDKFVYFISTLLQSQIQAKVFHWQVLEEGSFAAHKALDEYQDEIQDLIDKLVESYQGRFGIVEGFKPFSPFREDNDPLTYYDAVRKYVEINRYNFTQATYVQSIVDDVVVSIESLIYKLKYLK